MSSIIGNWFNKSSLLMEKTFKDYFQNLYSLLKIFLNHIDIGFIFIQVYLIGLS